MHTRTLSTLSAAAALAVASAAGAQTLTTTGSFDAGSAAFVEFTLGPGGTFLDITSNGSLDTLGGNGADTEIGLYMGLGPTATLVEDDDDDGLSVQSTLSFGTGSGLLLGDSFNLGGDGIANGEDGAMPAAGDYTLVIGEFNTVFPGVLGDISTFGNEDVTYIAEFYSDATVSLVPEPATASLLAVGGLALLRRRRA